MRIEALDLFLLHRSYANHCHRSHRHSKRPCGACRAAGALAALFTPVFAGAVQRWALGGIDQALGFLFGAARGILLIAIAFIVSSVMAGLAGMMFAYQQAYVSPDSFLILFSFLLLTMVLAGGIVSPLGAVVGGILLIALPELLREYSEYRELVYGLVLGSVYATIHKRAATS